MVFYTNWNFSSDQFSHVRQIRDYNLPDIQSRQRTEWKYLDGQNGEVCHVPQTVRWHGLHLDF